MPVHDLSPERRKALKGFEKVCGIKFLNLNLLNLSFTHRSFANETSALKQNNERLEFLGDSVLGLVISSYLFQILPDKAEGDLAKIKSFVVSEDILSDISKKLHVDQLLLIGKGEENSGGRQKKAILADALEAIIGAYFLDSGFMDAQKLVLSLLVPEINTVLEDKHKKDYKTLLQEYVQKNFRTYPKYVLLDKIGPDHDKTFFIQVQINGQTLGSGSGKNKKEAEQGAAAEAFKKITAS